MVQFHDAIQTQTTKDTSITKVFGPGLFLGVPSCPWWLAISQAAPLPSVAKYNRDSLWRTLYVGTSGWAYPTWKPAFYPEKLAQKKFLNFYASKLNAVEVNYTFRQLVKETTVQNWIAETPDHFRFTIKAHQVLTHIKRLKNADEFLRRFLSTLEGLGTSPKTRPAALSTPAELQGGSGGARRLSPVPAANRARRL
jgi:hypothetical protein